ncbi:MAG: DNA polymerase III subunit [Actinomycetota bacterium]|nr:DNA polymerase III subunit [Actinomycetota bacterium]
MLAELRRHPHARAVLAPAVDGGLVSHAYLFHGPGGSGKRAAARALAAELLSQGAPDPDGARARVHTGAHPDLTWVVPSGAHEILVSDIAEPVIAASSKTPFEARRRVFVIERVDELGDEAANRMLKTLEEPPSFAHLILLTDRLGEVLPTIRSRCQPVRFEALADEALAAGLEAGGVDTQTAMACVRLALHDAERAQELAGAEGQALRGAAEAYARAVLAGRSWAARPWSGLLAAVRQRGEAAAAELEAQATAELELTSRKERKRVQTEWNERIRRARRRAQTSALDLGLQLVTLWFGDLASLAWSAEELIRHCDRRSGLDEDAAGASGADPQRLRLAMELVEETRQRFQLNVTEELACEALAYRLEDALAP